jgi:hypothetical protein
VAPVCPVAPTNAGENPAITSISHHGYPPALTKSLLPPNDVSEVPPAI